MVIFKALIFTVLSFNHLGLNTFEPYLRHLIVCTVIAVLFVPDLNTNSIVNVLIKVKSHGTS